MTQGITVQLFRVLGVGYLGSQVSALRRDEDLWFMLVCAGRAFFPAGVHVHVLCILYIHTEIALNCTHRCLCTCMSLRMHPCFFWWLFNTVIALVF